MTELRVSPWTFGEMQRAAMQAEINGEDGALAAWRVTQLPLPSLPHPEPISVVVTNQNHRAEIHK